jgi:uncharacterized membrane protein
MIKLFNKIPPVIITLIFVLIIPYIIFFNSTRAYKDIYHEQSTEWLELCFRQNERVNLPANVCAQINASADNAFDLALSVYDSAIKMLIALLFVLSTFLLVLSKSVFSLKKQIEELKEKIDV